MTTEKEHGRIAYPALPNPLTARDLKQLFTPWPDEIEWAFNATWTAEARLGLLTLLKVFEALGRFIGPSDIPSEVVRHIARHIDLPERDTLAYTKNTLYRHQGLVREFLRRYEMEYGGIPSGQKRHGAVRLSAYASRRSY